MRFLGFLCAIVIALLLILTAILLNPIGKPPEGGTWRDNLLALSWQPAFCEQKPFKPECEQLNAGKLPQAQKGLSIHGLWPQPRNRSYCNQPPTIIRQDKAGSWTFLPELDLPRKTRTALVKAMPGTTSFLDRHEWIKHGTCYGGAGAADYYRDTLLLLEQINRSDVGRFLANNLGKDVKTADIRALFNQSFGQGAGERVSFKCWNDRGRMLLQELFINLRGEVSPDGNIGALLLAASPRSIGCTGGVIDPAGLQ